MEIFIASTFDKSVLESVVDGEGVRLAVFLTGCSFRCKGCHNPDSREINNGTKVAIEDLVQYILERMKEGIYSGITFSGGDPLFQHEALNETIKQLREKDPSLNIWCYTGHLYEDIKNLPVIKLLDVLVDGPFVESLRFPAKKFRGSNNQRILHLRNGEVFSET